MFFTPIKYHEPVFRPPAEANSAILQVTLGCSWNKCAFCEMYSSKQFRVRPLNNIVADIVVLSRFYKGIKKIFLADGNAFVLSANHLLPILEKINTSFGKIQRISSYALPKDIFNKTPEQLREIKDMGLKLLYIGIESGDDELLYLINKSETYNSTKEGILKAHEAGIETSVMVLNGLGGRKYSEQHAINSAKLINEIQPKLLSTLTLSLPFGQAHFQQKFTGDYIPQTIVELAEELKLFVSNTQLQNTIFRSDHVSNNLVLKGVLSKDKDVLINTIEETIQNIDKNLYPGVPMML
jgi:radical SAM superfamily enzyme YgiQ (UPF0313 family)